MDNNISNNDVDITIPDANHGAGIFIYIETPNMDQFCMYIFQHHGTFGYDMILYDMFIIIKEWLLDIIHHTLLVIGDGKYHVIYMHIYI